MERRVGLDLVADRGVRLEHRARRDADRAVIEVVDLRIERPLAHQRAAEPRRFERGRRCRLCFGSHGAKPTATPALRRDPMSEGEGGGSGPMRPISDRLLCRCRRRLASHGGASVRAGGDERRRYLRRNRDYWNGQAAWYAERAPAAWTQDEPDWGIWSIPEREVGMLRGVAPGMRVLEDGCGTGYVSAWMARRGARVVGLDNSPAQLATAWRLRREHELPHRPGSRRRRSASVRRRQLRLRHLRVRRGDLGRSLSLDPGSVAGPSPRRRAGVPRQLAPAHALHARPRRRATGEACAGARSAAASTASTGPTTASIEFHLGHGDWFRLFHHNGFDVEDLLELYPPEGATTRYEFVTVEWARRWPSEEVWRVRKRKV